MFGRDSGNNRVAAYVFHLMTAVRKLAYLKYEITVGDRCLVIS